MEFEVKKTLKDDNEMIRELQRMRERLLRENRALGELIERLTGRQGDKEKGRQGDREKGGREDC
jgi:hypothetical protein